ncbi:MFS transporter [Thermomicrobium sp. 4228-Ro]|uniref:MFS transporter n=1 Tax=Thermomicrobium sp. 4228-Ro TaxID=2993937 RepID=UPI00224976D3|nr:MFS transporter [Thermomicrobium sp. 4228-Ro]MCX2727898.1 MFS transporter [Thermomicrobium sp. 4228-Ro]
MTRARQPERSAAAVTWSSDRGVGSLLAALIDYRAYRFLWLSSVLTQIGQWMLQVATAWLMLQLTDSAFWVGLLGFAGGIPFLFVAAPAGTLSERVDRRTMLLVCQGGALALSVGLAALVLAQRVSPWLLLGATLLNGMLLAANNATRQAVIPSYVPREAVPNAVSLLSAGMNMTRIVGPSLAGPMVATLGVSGTLLLQAGCLALALLNTGRLPRTPQASRAPESFLESLVGGIRYVRRMPVVLALLLLASVPTLLVFPYLQLLPVLARDVLHLGPSGLGLLYAVGGTGALAGSLFVAGFQRIRRRGAAMVTVIVLYGFVVSLFTLVHWLPVVSLCLFAAGFLGASYMALNNALLHLAVDDEVRGRVMGLYMVTWGFMPLGALPLGALGDVIGIDHALLIGALATSALSLFVAWRVPAVFRLT